MVDMRKHFKLPEIDEAYLEARGLPWEAVIEGQVQRVVLYDQPIPPGYDQKTATINVRLQSGYPDVQIDMASFYPKLRRSDGRVIYAVMSDTFDGKEWQCWSRHRTGANPWRPGIDNLETHFLMMEYLLTKEVTR